jgi:phosphoribosylformimino-5-aminoimidazole carboxamide ribotide isomerase
MLIYPAIDIYDGKCVRLKQGDYAEQTVYSDSPVDVARRFLDNGFDHLHIVDLQGAREGRPVNDQVIRSILALKGVHAQVGGGIRRSEDVERLFEAGAYRIVLGSVAVQFPQRVHDWMQDYPGDRWVVAVDVRDGAVTHSGWLKQEPIGPSAFIGDMARAGATHFLCTRIERDGMLQGPDIGLSGAFPGLRFIASGGVSRISDIQELKNAGCVGVIVGKALYEGRVKLDELAALSTRE